MQNAIFFFQNRVCKVQIAVFACKCVLRSVKYTPNPSFRNTTFFHHIKGVFGEDVVGHGLVILTHWVVFFFVQPGLNPWLGTEFLIQLAHGGLVRGGMAEEDAEWAGHERMKDE